MTLEWTKGERGENCPVENPLGDIHLYVEDDEDFVEVSFHVPRGQAKPLAEKVLRLIEAEVSALNQSKPEGE